MHRGRDIKHRDGRRNIGLVTDKHQVKEPIIPAQNESKAADAGKNHPAQQGQVVGGEFAFQDTYGHFGLFFWVDMPAAGQR